MEKMICLSIIVSNRASTFPESNVRDILFEIFSNTEIKKGLIKPMNFGKKNALFTCLKTKKCWVCTRLKILTILAKLL